MGHAQVSCEGTGIVRHRIPAPGNADPKEYNDDQGNAHDYALNQVRGGDSHESAQDRVADDDNSAHNHGHVVVYAEQAVEQGSHRLKS